MATERASPTPCELSCCSCRLQLVRPVWQTPCGDRICGRCYSNEMARLRCVRSIPLHALHDTVCTSALCRIVVVAYKVMHKISIMLNPFSFSNNQLSGVIQCTTCLTQIDLNDVRVGVQLRVLGLLFRLYIQCFRDRAAEKELDEASIPFMCSDSSRCETGLECEVCIR